MLGIIGRKMGMTQVFAEDGAVIPVTVIQFEDNIVIGKKVREKDGYDAVVVGAIDRSEKRVKKPLRGQFAQIEGCKRVIMEFATDDEAQRLVGYKYNVENFADLSYVDVTGCSKGKGFQGVMRRHNFGGGRKTHGSKFHRAAGSTGMAASPSRVHKGTKMAGRMGGIKSTMLNLRVVEVDGERKLMLVRGAVPGAVNSLVVVRKAKKK